MLTSFQAKLNEIQPNKEVGGIVLPVIFEILKKWSLSVNDQMIILGLDSEKTLDCWATHPEQVEMTTDLLIRISNVLGIFKSLEILIPDPDVADRWLSTGNDNPVFGGTPPLDRIRSGAIKDIAAVRNFLYVQQCGLGSL